MTAQITWALCPNGIDTTKGAFRLSVIVSPVLASMADLGLASGQTWPQKMAAMSPTLYVGTTPIALSPAMLDTSVMSLYPGLWNELFGSSPPVNAVTRPNVPSMNIISYDSHTVSGEMHSAYVSAAALAVPKPALPVPASPGAALTGPLAPFATLRSQVFATSESAAQNGPAIMAQITTAKEALLRTTLTATTSSLRGTLMSNVGSSYSPTYVGTAVFHNRNNLRSVTSVPAPPTPATPDFHDVLAQLADQPEILRALGMVLDYEVPLAAISSALYSSASAPTTVHFAPPSGFVGTQTTPMTTVVIDATAFYAIAPAGTASDVDQGMLTLDSANFLVEQLDLDHAVNTLATATVDTSGDETSIPALRSHGFQILRTARDAYFQGRVTKSYAVAATTGTAATPLYSDDLVRGYRVDVSAGGGPWKPLCKRAGTVTVGTGTTAITVTLPSPTTPLGDYAFARDEGYVKASAATSPADAPSLLQLHESVFGWSGWSLVARHPGLAAGYSAGTTVMGSTANQSPAGSPFTVSQSVTARAGSLPKLRYGTSYQFRARVVDLAGNSLPLSTTTTHVTPAQTFGRYDPLLTPTLVPRQMITEGEALERLVIRSSGVSGVTATAFAPTVAAAAATNTPSVATVPAYGGTCERHVVPPKVAYMTAERHGMFDAMAPATAYAFAAQDGSFLWPPAAVASTTCVAAPVPAGGASSTSLTTWQAQQGSAGLPAGSALTPGSYLYDTGTAVSVPYLPDPLVAGMQVSTSTDIATDENAATTTSISQPALSATKAFGGLPAAWPNVTPYRLVLQDSQGAAPSIVANGSDGNLDVYIPAGTMLWLDYSAVVQTGDVAEGGTTTGLQHLGWYNELAASNPTAASQVESAIAGGKHWLFTPRRQLQLVHATLQPVQAPTLTALAATRPANATYAFIGATVGAHSPSTAHVDLMAQWKDWDDASGTWVLRAAKVGQTMFAYGQGPQTITGVKQEFADTKARQVSYTPVGTTRYREYFPASMTAQSSAITLAGAPFAPVAATSTQLAGAVVPASRNPPPPKPLYVIPSYLRTVSGTTSTRLGSTLRVYLDRPWYDSGFGEQLAIVCQPASPPAGSNAPSIDKLSQVGLDPLYIAEGGAAATATFALPLSSSTGIYASQIQVDTSGRMQLVPNHQLPDGSFVDLVVFNVDRSDTATDSRGLFFVDVTMPSYAFLFVSFSLARYQPNAINAATQLSTLARADFTRISADRAASVTSTTSGTTSTVAISVTGPAASPVLQPQPVTTTTTPVHSGGGGGGPPNTHEFKLTAQVTTTTDPTSAQYAAAGAAGRYVQATLEYTTNPAPADLDNELGWQQGPTTPLTATSGAEENVYATIVTWTGSISFARATGTRYRVVLREFEVRGADPDVALASTATSWMGSPQGATWRLDALVYTDILAC